MRHIFIKHKLILLAILLMATVATWFVVRMLPASEDDIRHSTCFVTGHSTLCLVDDSDTILLRSDSVSQQGVWINRHWWWPSCDGRVLTMYRDNVSSHTPWLTNADSLRSFVAVTTDSLSQLLGRKETERKELIYYLRSHGVIDEGYTQIAAYAQRQSRETDSLKHLVSKLRSWLSKSPDTDQDKANHKVQTSNFKFQRIFDCTVSWYDDNDSLQSVACRPLLVTIGSHPVILHTRRSIKPWGVYAVRNVMWGAPSHKKIITVTLSTAAPKGKENILATGNYDHRTGHDLPHIFAVDGSPVFTQHGRFIGIISGKEVQQ